MIALLTVLSLAPSILTRAGAGIRHFRAQARFRNKLSVVSPISDHRPCCGLGSYVDGHDDAATGRGLPPIQADLFRAG